MSERIWAAIDDGIITNTFIGGDDFADLVRPEHDAVVEITNMSPRPGVDWLVVNGDYRTPQPYPSWSWIDGAWAAPVPRPSGDYWMWDETTQDWIDYSPPAE